MVLGVKGYVGGNAHAGPSQPWCLSDGLKTLQQQNELAQESPPDDIQTTAPCGNCIFTIKREVKCRKSTCPYISGAVYQNLE